MRRGRLKSLATKLSFGLLALVIAAGAFAGILGMALGVGAVIAFAVTLLWNFAVAPAFGLGAAKFLHVWGILILAHIVIRLVRSAVTA